jgi:hypothetical protein
VDHVLLAWEHSGGLGIASARYGSDRIAVARLADGRTRVLVAMGRCQVVACARARTAPQLAAHTVVSMALCAAPLVTLVTAGPAPAITAALVLGLGVAWRWTRPHLVASP